MTAENKIVQSFKFLVVSCEFLDRIIVSKLKSQNSNLFLLFFLFLTLNSQLSTLNLLHSAGVGSSGAQFLKLGVGARASAMGESFVAVANDVSAIYYNPAGIARLPSRELAASHYSFISGINYNTFIYAHPTRIGTFGTGVNYLTIGGIERRDKNEQLQGNVGASDIAFSFSFARPLLSGINKSSPLSSQLSGGINVKVIRQEIDTFQAQALAVDFGIITPVRNSRFHLGLAVQNLGTDVRFANESYPLPQTIRAGLSYQAKKFPATFAGSVSLPRDNSPSFQLGGEYWILSSFAMRSGYMMRPKNDLSIFKGIGSKTDNAISQLTGLMAGAGLKFFNFQMDYAFVPLGDLGNTHQISLSMRFK